MQSLNKTIQINAPVAETFNFVANPLNLVDVWPSVVDSQIVAKLPNGGCKSRFVYRMAGIRIEGISEDVEWVSNKRIVTQTIGGVDSRLIWEFQPQAGGTRLDLSTEYRIPIFLIGKVAETLLVRVNKGELEAMVVFLKARVEWEYGRKAAK